MSRLVFTLFSIFIFATSCIGQEGKEKFPVSKINSELTDTGHPKILVFMPSVSDSTEYASMIVQAFKNYFVQKLAFKPEDRPLADVDVVLITEENKGYQDTLKEKALTTQVNLFYKQELLANLFDITGMYTEEADSVLLSELNIPLFDDYNAGSVLFLLDKENNIVWRDNDYRGQGEHLKPLEYKVKELLGLDYPKPENRIVDLKVGDQAPDIVLVDDVVHSDGIRVLTFYPAAYSGVFDINSMARRISMEHMSMMSCALQISSLDRLTLGNSDVHYYAISESTPEILDNWKAALGTHHIRYVNDPDYSIALAFGAYNPEGYDNRMTVIIDKDGKIAYLDKDYKFEKEAEIQKVIQDLQKDN